MIRTKIKVLSAVAFGLSAVSAVAQPANQFFLKALPQAYYLNPGQLPEGNGHIGFLGLGYQYGEATSTGFQLSDMMVAKDTLSLQGAANSSSLADDNYLGMAFRKDLLNVGWRWKEKSYWSIVMATRMMADFNYSRDFLNVLTQGNGATEFLAKGAVDLDGTRYSINIFNEFGIGYARQVNDQLSIGGKLKYLQGLGNFNGNFDGIKVTTAEDLTSMTIASSLSVQSATPLDTAGAFDQANATSNGAGFGMDLGGSYKVNDQITAYASVVDFGVISWGQGKTLSNNNVSFTFNGFTYAEFSDTTGGDVFTDLTDSIQDVFKLDEEAGGYTTYLPTRFFLGGSYQFHENLSADVLYSGRMTNGKLLNSATIGLGIKGGKWYEGKLTYTIAHDTYANVGWASVLNLGPFQLYFVTDNILGLFQLDYSKHVSGAAGINLTFGRNKYYDNLKSQKSAPDMPATTDSTSTVPAAPNGEAAKKEMDDLKKDTKEDVKDAKKDAKKAEEKAEDKAEDAKDDAKDAADDAKDDAKDAAKDAKKEAEKAKEDAEKAVEKAEEKAEKRIQKAEEQADEAAEKMKQMEADKAAAEKAAMEKAAVPATVDSISAPVVNVPQDTTATQDLVPAAPSSTTDSTQAELSTPSMDELQKAVEEIKQKGAAEEKAAPADVK